MKYYLVLFAGALALCLGSCSSSKQLSVPATTIHLPDTLPSLPDSRIDLPLKVAGRPLLAFADSMVPREFTSDGWPNYLQTSCDFRYKYRFVRSGFTLTCNDNTLHVQMRASYQVAGGRCFCTLGKPVSPWISGNCGFGAEPMRRVDIGLSSRFSFLPDFSVRTATQIDQLKALDKCTVSLMSTDITQQILDSIHSSINTFCTTLDQTVAGMNFSGFLHQATAKSWQKTPIGPYGYFAIRPEEIRLGALNYTKDTFNITIGLTCRPELSSDSSSGPAPAILPSLRTNNQRNGIFLYLRAVYDYAFISKALNDSVRNKSFLFKGRNVIVRDVAVKGIGHHQVEIRIDFAGDRKGRIYLRGTPVLDTAKQTLSVPDISYSLESKDMALKMARSLLHNKIKRSLRGSSYLDLATLVKSNMPALDAQWNRQLAPNLFTTGHTKELKVIGMLPGDKSIEVQLYVSANLSVTSTGLPNTHVVYGH